MSCKKRVITLCQVQNGQVELLKMKMQNWATPPHAPTRTGRILFCKRENIVWTNIVILVEIHFQLPHVCVCRNGAPECAAVHILQPQTTAHICPYLEVRTVQPRGVCDYVAHARRFAFCPTEGSGEARLWRFSWNHATDKPSALRRNHTATELIETADESKQAGKALGFHVNV